MQELTDDQLDGLFRKSAEEFDPPFDPAAWQAMRNQLDTHDRTTAGPVQLRERLIRWGLPLVLLFMLLLIGGSWYTSRQEYSRRTAPAQSGLATTGNTPPNRRVWAPLAFDPLASPGPEPATERTLARVKEEKKVTIPAVATLARIKTKALPNGTSSTNKPLPEPATIRPYDEAVPDRPAALSSAPEPLPVRPATERSTSSRNRSQTRQTRRRLTSPNKSLTSRADQRSLAMIGLTGSANSFKPARQPFRTANPDWTAPVADVSSAASQPVETVDQPRLTTTSSSSVTWLAIRPGQWPDKVAFTTRPVTAQPDTAARQQPASASSSIPRGLSVRFMVSPDLSAVGLRNFARPGTNVGLALEYRLASRWSLQAGAVWSHKVYNARPTDYEWPAHWYWKVKPTGVSGECTMIDIPINLRYDVISQTRSNGRPPNRWFVSGGVTSYILLKEDYTYNYATPSDPGIRYRSLAVDSTTRYGLSHLNLSVGYERALSRRLSWQIEPFMKVPLKGVGYFKIDLLSTGAFLSLRYKL
ncbi:hypothetical protein [Spirosoma sp. 209]|uniref:hypothetical protein n=1 Tax=Spirosoma sp. 209 TaxID=1955701 RepID=UPI00098D4165|nr:hypothetical protein [Spirosoma sp. 209]